MTETELKKIIIEDRFPNAITKQFKVTLKDGSSFFATIDDTGGLECGEIDPLIKFVELSTQVNIRRKYHLSEMDSISTIER